MPHSNKRTYFSLAIFLLGLLVTVIALQFPAPQQFITNLGQAGLWGAFVAGILYAFAFTSSLATVIFFHTPESVPPLLAALVGGAGAAVYDLTVFALVRGQASHGLLQTLRARLTRPSLPTWLSVGIGLLILGSPLPDELAAGLLGFANLSAKKFIAVSFLANTVGLLIITLIR